MANADTDMVLLDRFAKLRDSDAFAELIQRYAHMVFASCFRILKDSNRAQEASQEIFFKLLKNPGSVTQSVGAWLHATAVNFSLDTLRSDSARVRREQEYASRQAREHTTQSPADAASEPTWAELSGHVDELLCELPDEYREILIAHYLQGRTQNEIAVELNLSTATLSRRVTAAIAMLQQKLKSRGVHIAPIALCGLFKDHAMQAVPEALRAQLGKMTMVSGPTGNLAAVSSTGVASGPSVVWVVIAILFACILAGFISMLIGSRRSHPTPTGNVSADISYQR